MTETTTTTPQIEEYLPKTHDRGIDLQDIKVRMLEELAKEKTNYTSSRYKKRAGKNVIYLLIELIQLRNGSRISEAITAFRRFMEVGIEQKVWVKISKSESVKHIKDIQTGEKKTITTKPRYREIMFPPPSWIDREGLADILASLKKTHKNIIEYNRLRYNIVGYMNRRFNCNTHSLRYAFINYMLYVEKRNENAVAKFVGHANVNQLMRYTQQKNCDAIHEIDF